jgi:hypothetical protein
MKNQVFQLFFHRFFKSFQLFLKDLIHCRNKNFIFNLNFREFSIQKPEKIWSAFWKHQVQNKKRYFHSVHFRSSAKHHHLHILALAFDRTILNSSVKFNKNSKNMRFVIVLGLFLVISNQKVSTQVTFLDNFLPFLRFTRERLNLFIQPKTFDIGVALNVKNKRTQTQFKENFPFFCDVAGGRSETVPTSVHKLRPGDIDLVGAIGDSLTTGASTFSLDALQVMLDGKGAVWSIGGQKTWRQFLTIPNILKEFNPKIYGFSITGQGNSFKNSSKFNVAEILVREKV